ncbi:SusC/RagA family TonB-linked outer membrane protein [Salegentibacter sp. BDJ18]|uniref:SusC/RagA family TonB-linked outer membrane protein n=1 Tax=Salegentibacter sp. BDJ18 TaxID=2816376 RepID=UPI001AAF2548|nr:SusC/RagA family TonB-linked outer membrane protein [Salegentibacter sp. BDJ18]MBO2543582.1 SusC/RagA family TonB-linked outer membrane protein [Salegentibacter sp. BDJ18]
MFFCLPIIGNSAQISFVLDNPSLKELILEIESQSDFKFAYGNEIDVETKLTGKYTFQDEDLAKILTSLSTETPFSFEVLGNNIAITEDLPVNRDKVKKSKPQMNIEGNVTDSNGMPLPSVTVQEEGTNNGVMTDFDGNFNIEVSSDDAVLIFSYVGMQTTRKTAEGNTTMNVQMEEDAQALDEVMVVGYGTQKRGSVVGAVSQVNSEDMENRSVTRLSEALTGQMPGVTIIQRSGRPGYSAGDISVRGVGSFGADPSALVLIDGIPGSMNDINPNDVESVSVLKDAATAAVYGSRAANGVILVTTKSGREGRTRITYNAYVGVQRATELPDLVNSWEYAELYNEAIGNTVFTPEDIQNFREGNNPDNFPNTDFIGEVFSRDPIQTSHNLQVSGGNETSQYVVSLGYLNQKGLLERNDYSRYNLRLNLTNELSENLTLITRLSGANEIINEPAPPAGIEFTTMDQIIGEVVRVPSIYAGRLSNGYFGVGHAAMGTPISYMGSESFYYDKPYSLNANMRLDWQVLSDLKLSLIGGYNRETRLQKRFLASQQLNEEILLGPTELTQINDNSYYATVQAFAEYDKVFGDHTFNVLGGYSFETSHWETMSGFRYLQGNSLQEINTGDTDGQWINGTATEWALQSVFGRVRYDFANKYLFESTVRYDGSSKFPTEYKYGLFPSVALGWRISEEDFFSVPRVTDLKLKASFGEVGNQNIGNYPYQNILSADYGYPFGGTYQTGVAATRLTDSLLHWETTRSFNTGIDLSILNGDLDVSVNYFNRKTYDILYQPSSSVSMVLGKDMSETNTGSLRNSGWEFEANYRKYFNDFSFRISPNFSIINNEVLDLGVGNIEQENGLVGNGTDLFIGHPMQTYYGYVADGLFGNENDVASWPDMSRVNPNAQPGDIRYRDISGPEGVPDGQVDATYDRRILGSRIPKYNFGMAFGAEYKGFDFSVLLQGVADAVGRLQGYAGYAFNNTASVQRWMMDRWAPENPNPNAAYPRYELIPNSGTPNTELSTFWLPDASYVRVKNVQVGYRFPSNILENLRIENLRIYASGENLYTWNNYRQGWDPEINTNGRFYPIFANYTIGLNVNF